MTTKNLGYFAYQTRFSLLEQTTAGRLYSSITNLISDPSTPVFYTDAYGMDWIRVAFEINQPNANDGASVLLKSLKVIYNHTHKLSGDSGFEDSLREFVAKNLQSNSQGNNLLEVPITTYGDSGGRLLLSNLTVLTEPGYYSSLNWNSQSLSLIHI